MKVMVPMLTNDLFEIMHKTSMYARVSYYAKKRGNHVLISGNANSCSLREFFEELFHIDHENINLHAVILLPHPPTFEMLSILKDDVFSFSITYLEGSPLIEKDLKRACADKAMAVFLLTNKFTSNPDKEDSHIILQQLSITRFSEMSSSRFTPPFCKQLIRPENRRHIADSNEFGDMVVCINEIKMGMFAKAALFPGTNTLIMNLTASFSDENEGVETDKKNDHSGIDVLDDNGEDKAWLVEYKHGT